MSRGLWHPERYSAGCRAMHSQPCAKREAPQTAGLRPRQLRRINSREWHLGYVIADASTYEEGEVRYRTSGLPLLILPKQDPLGEDRKHIRIERLVYLHLVRPPTRAMVVKPHLHGSLLKELVDTAQKPVGIVDLTGGAYDVPRLDEPLHAGAAVATQEAQPSLGLHLMVHADAPRERWVYSFFDAR